MSGRWGQRERGVEAGRELACPGPGFGDSDFAFALAADDTGGGVQQPVAQGFGFRAAQRPVQAQQA